MNGLSSEVVPFMGLVFIVIGAVWLKCDQIWKAISDIKVNSVTHEVCHQRRSECRCKKDIEVIKEQIKDL